MNVFIIVWVLWLASEIALNRLKRTKEKTEKDYDKGSIAIIWLVIIIANTLAIVSKNLIQLPVSSHMTIPYIGLFIIVFGMLVRAYSIRMLGKMFTVNVNISNNHRLVKSGIYKYIRHPSYLGAILSFIGFGLSLNNWISIFIVSVAIPAVMIYRINIEEKALAEKFGSEYNEYCKASYRLVPFVY